MTAFEYLKWIRDERNFLPLSREQKGKTKKVIGMFKAMNPKDKTEGYVDVPIGDPSNAEIKRWLRKKSILINGKTPDVNDEIEFPVWELVFFYKGKYRCTIW